MSTPQRSKTPASTPLAKDSPTSIFFNNLSPIQVISSKLISQSFDNIDVLSPQPVFATPQNRLTNLKLRKRSQSLAFHSPQKICPSDAVVSTTSLQHPDTARGFIPVETVELSNCSDRKYKTDDHAHAEICSIPTNGVDEFLSIPIDDCENSSCSPGYLLDDACDLVLDKDTALVNTDRNQVVCPNSDSVQVPSIKSLSTETDYVDECTEHRDLVIMTDVQPNEAVLSQEFRNNATVYESRTSEFLVSNAEESFNINAVQNLAHQPEHNSDMHMPNCQTVSSTFEKFENLGGPFNMKIEENLNSFDDSDSYAQNEPITLDREEPIDSCVSNTMNFRNADHVDGCPSTSGSYLFGIQDVEFHLSNPLGHLDSVYEEKCEILSNNQLHYHHHGISRQLKDEPAKSQITYDQEDVPHHSRGMYKRLQFEDVGKKERCVAYTDNSANLKSSCFMPAKETMPSIMESSNASTSNTITIPARIPKVQLPSGNSSGNHLSNTNFSKQSRERCTAVVPRTFGIGLHLNAIGTSGQMSCPMDSSGPRAKAISPNACEETSQPLNKTILTRNREASVQLNSNSDDSSFGSMGECNSELYPKLLDSVPDCHSPFDVEPSDMCMHPEFSDHHITPCSRIRLPSVEEVSFQNSLGKKRKKAPEIEGQKRCNCKRSKCLKLYCDCFAAGVFCNEACACQGCSNNCENEETVSSTRQQIEARNPLAFAPRVVHANGGLNDSVDNKHITPPSARHKRGCNCKKSKCLKKYCECFQAGVGCSLACRCEGCKNAFGTKEACGDITEMILEHQRPKGDGLDRESSAGTLEVIMNVNSQKVPNTKRFSSPPAPLMQCTKVNSVVARLHINPASCHPSLESKFTSVPSLDSSTLMNQTSHSLHADKNEEVLSVLPYPARSNSTSLSPSLCESSVPKAEHANIYSSKFVHHCSPAPKQGLLGEGRFIIKPVVDGLHCLLTDETPEILNCSSRSPIRTVKISSPNQKRVSPPKKPLLKAGSSFSAGLRSGRKYVLNSIPQFPSLTPYRNSYKDNGIESPSKDKDNGRHSEDNRSKTDIPMLESQL